MRGIMSQVETWYLDEIEEIISKLNSDDAIRLEELIIELIEQIKDEGM